MPGVNSTCAMKIVNSSESAFTGQINLHIDHPQGEVKKNTSLALKGKEEKQIAADYVIYHTGDQILKIQIVDDKNIEFYNAEIPFSVSFLNDADFGELITSTGSEDIWWSKATYKISKNRPAPQKKSGGIKISAAKGEFEPFQIVVTPKSVTKNFSIEAGDLTGASGSIISKENITIKQVDYVPIAKPSDLWGCKGLWPDPLPLFDAPKDLSAGCNWPFWITVKIPENAVAGIYQGNLQLTSDNSKQTIPFAVQVYNFSLPKSPSMKSAFGFSPAEVQRYHNLKTPEELDNVIDLYNQNFRDHRISPYNPVSQHPIKYELVKDKLEFRFDFADFEKAGKRYFDDFGFTTYHLPLVGMGGGTFQSRSKGKIGSYEQGTPEHEKLFKNFASTLENYLREKGWLDKGYVYWFDEPEEKDYEFVQEGMDLIHRNAPGLKRMLTEEPGKELSGYVDIWCPILDQYKEKDCVEQQKAGKEIWWYICTGPKQPYPGLFIDHPAVDLRTWLWMSQKYHVQGCLVWQSNYWTSSAAFPAPAMQDPWQDPMSYVSDYDYPPGFKGYWGNGDGRFIYPPKDWNSSTKKICGPVDSIRWEMLREGMEDFEYFHQLEQMINSGKLSDSQKEQAEKLLQIPETIIRSTKDYTKNPEEMYILRDKIGRFIEENLKGNASVEFKNQ